MAADPQLTFAEISRLMAGIGSEDHLAARIQREREDRGWSQSELARQMAASGHPIPQTAISKIEKAQPGGRRAITVDEAIAFARVFGVSFVELVLPPDSLKQLAIMRDLEDGPGALVARDDAQIRYEGIAQRLTNLCSQDQQWRETLDMEFRRAVDDQYAQPDSAPVIARAQFLRDVLDRVSSEVSS